MTTTSTTNQGQTDSRRPSRTGSHRRGQRGSRRRCGAPPSAQTSSPIFVRVARILAQLLAEFAHRLGQPRDLIAQLRRFGVASDGVGVASGEVCSKLVDPRNVLHALTRSQLDELDLVSIPMFVARRIARPVMPVSRPGLLLVHGEGLPVSVGSDRARCALSHKCPEARRARRGRRLRFLGRRRPRATSRRLRHRSAPGTRRAFRDR